jgi:hypothetical protein
VTIASLCRTVSDRAVQAGDLTMTRIKISDHALVRWLERVRGFRLDLERREIDDLLHGVGKNGTIKAFGRLFEVSNNVLVTITPDSGYPNKTRRLKVTRKGI